MTRTVLALCALLSSACYVIAKPSDDWHAVGTTTEKTSHTSPTYGTQETLSFAEVADGLLASVNEYPVCRRRWKGHEMVTQKRLRTASDLPGWLVGLGGVAGGVSVAATAPSDDRSLRTTGFAVAGSSLLVPIIYVLATTKAVTDERVQRGQDVEGWAEEEACAEAPRSPVAKEALRIEAKFGSTTEYLYWTRTTDEKGQAVVAVARVIAAVAGHCGGSSRVKVSVQATEVEKQSRERRPPPAVEITVGSSPAAVDSIGDPVARKIALQCHAAGVQQCLATRTAEQARFREECKLSCIGEVGADACMSKLTQCIAVAMNDEEKRLCDPILTQCLNDEGIPSQKTDACRDRCFQRKADALCGGR